MTGESVGQTRRVLVVEDNPDVSASLQMLLEASGYEVRCADTGRRALEEARRFVPEVVLLDLGLPDMSGQDVLKGLRALDEVRDASIIALSGRDLDEDEVAAEDSFDHHVLKPPDVDQLLSLLPPP